MATEIGWAGLGIIPTFDKFGTNLERGTTKAMTAAGVTGGEAFGDSAGKAAGSRFNSRLKSIARVGALGLAATAAGALKFGGDAIGEAREAQKVAALTRSTIKATGGAAKVTARQVEDLSGAISDKVGIDDEAIQSGANMLLTFKNLRNEAGAGNDIFNQATETLIDMSSALGTDAKSSAIQLGKALNDPIKGVTALSRVGVTFTDQQKDQIKQLVKSGDTMKAQKMILRELTSEFGGAAAAQATEADKLTVAWGNFQEEVGTALIPVMDDLAVFLRKKGIPAAQEFFGWVRDDGIPMAKDFADFARDAGGAVKDLVGFLDDLPKPAKVAGIVALLGGIGAMKLRGGKGGILGTAGSALGLTKPIPVFVVNNGVGGGPDGKPGKPGRPKIPGTPVPLAAAPYLAPLLTGGDRAPGGYDKGAQGSVKYLGDALGLGRSGKGLDSALARLVSQEPDKAFKIISRAAKIAGEDVNSYLNEDALPKSVAAVRNAQERYGGLERAGDKVGRGARRLAAEVFGVTKELRDAAEAAGTYKRYLEDIPRRVRTDFITNRLDKNEGQLERFGGYRANGGTVERGKSYIVGERRAERFVPNEPGRIEPRVGSAGVQVNIDKVVAQDYRDFTQQVQRRARAAAGGGVNF